jgi:hypothetical protein
VAHRHVFWHLAGHAVLGEFNAALSAAMEAPALLKQDVQGFELQALRKCEDMPSHFVWGTI